MKILLCLLLCLLTTSFAARAQPRIDVSLGVLQSVDTYESQLLVSEKQPWISVGEASQKPFKHPGVRGRFALSTPINERFHAIVQTGANLRIAEYLWGYTHTYGTIPLQGGLAYALIKSKSYILAVQAYSGVNLFCIYNPVARQQTGSLHNAELSCRLGKENQHKLLVIKAGYELETDRETYFYQATESFLHDENFIYKVKRHQVYLAVGLAL